MRRSCLPLGLTVLLAAAGARADSGEVAPVAAGLFAGGATALLPLAFGATVIASTHDRTTQNASVYVMGAGLSLSPFVAHGVVHEWRRGALFSLPPAAAMVGMAALLQSSSDVVSGGKLPPQYAFVALFCTALFSSAFGVVDVAGAGDRAFLRGVTVTPTAGRDQLGVSVGGLL